MCSEIVLIARIELALEMPMPCFFISRVKRSRPICRSSERLALLKNPRILLRAEGVFTMFSQSREGVALFCVRISTRSPSCSS